MKYIYAILAIGIALILPSAIAFPVNAAQGNYLAASGTTPSWASTGAYLNYSLSGNIGFGLTLSNGSSISYSAITGCLDT